MQLLSAAVLMVATGLTTRLPAQSKEPLTRVVRIPSTALSEARIVHGSVPPNYRLAKRPDPVVVLLDGQVRAFFDLAVAATAPDSCWMNCC